MYNSKELLVQWKGYEDPESDIDGYQVLLKQGADCNAPPLSDEEQFVSFPKDITTYKIQNLDLQVYILMFSAYNSYRHLARTAIPRFKVSD